MTKKREGEPWMPAPLYAAGLRGLSINLLVRDVDVAVRFQREILQASVIYCDPDIAVLERGSAQWMLHADHTYDGHPLYGELENPRPRGLGSELRLHEHDPDQAEARARNAGYQVLQETQDKAHGLRECYIRDPDGYVWVVDRPLQQLP